MDYAKKIAFLTGSRVKENAPKLSVATPENEVQARWYSGEFGNRFQDTGGQTISILDFGRWNHESGPDFKDCEIQINDGDSLRGDIEIDLDVRNWERHGHAANPRFNDVVLHVFLSSPSTTFFTRTASHRNIPQMQLPVPLLSHGRDFQPVGASSFVEWTDAEITQFLEAAAQYRLRQKAIALGKIISAHGEENALFQAIAIAFGYKNNQIPFLLLAQRAGLSRIRERTGEALLFGIAGFLQGSEFHLYKDKSRSYQRELWDAWWSMRSTFERLVLDARAWNLSGCRPVNHPHRRVAALASVGKRFSSIMKAFTGNDDAESCAREFHALHHPFWEQNWSLASDSLPRRLSLLGEQRISEILTNVFFPYRLLRFEDGWDAFCKRTEPPYRQLREDMQHFFGSRPLMLSQLSRCVIQQGLLQVTRDLGRKRVQGMAKRSTPIHKNR